MTIQEKIEAGLDKVRPMMGADGGGVKFVSWDEETKTVQVQLTGMCVGCPMAQVTLKNGIEVELKKEVPEIENVESV